MGISEVMDLCLDDDISDQQLIDLLSHASAGRMLRCRSEVLFLRLRNLISSRGCLGVQVQLLDSDGYVMRTYTSSVRSSEESEGFTERQVTVIRALERVLSYCREEGIQLIGYSDELVAVPADGGKGAVVSAAALPVESSGVYLGVEALEEEF